MLALPQPVLRNGLHFHMFMRVYTPQIAIIGVLVSSLRYVFQTLRLVVMIRTQVRCEEWVLQSFCP